MRPTRPLCWLGALALTLSACRRDAPPPAAPTEAPAPASAPTEVSAEAPAEPAPPCEDAVKIELSAPDADHRASFEVRPSLLEHPNAPECYVARIGDREVALAPGEPVAIGAHPTELQRLQIGHQAVLLHVPPGQAVAIGAHPCFGWEFVSPALQIESADAQVASCTPAGRECPPEREAVTTRLAVDPLCPEELEGQDTQRCVSPTLVQLDPPGAWTEGATLAPVGAVAEEDAEPVPGPMQPPARLLPRSCGFVAARTRADRVGLAVGFGQRWRLTIDPGGRISGYIDTRQRSDPPKGPTFKKP